VTALTRVGAIAKMPSTPTVNPVRRSDMYGVLSNARAHPGMSPFLARKAALSCTVDASLV
jgi:hypothetical protein